MKRTHLRRKTPLKAGGKRLRAKKPARGRESTRMPEAARSPDHRAWIAEQPCCLIGIRATGHPFPHMCAGDVVAAHIRIGTKGGTGYKPNDGYTLPMCSINAHGEEHEGARTFAAKWGFDPKAKAIEYADRSPFRSELGNL